MSTSETYGRILVASQIEEAVILTLQKWFPSYLAEIARQLGISDNDVPKPQNYTNRNSLDSEAGEKIPKVVVISPGTLGPPLMRGGGQYAATWRLGVGVATAAKDEETANLHSKIYGAAAAAILIHNNDLGGTISGIAQIQWLGMSFDDLPIPNQLQLYKAATLEFAIDIENVVTKGKGPDAPTIAAPPAYTEVNTIGITLQKVGVIS